MSIKSQSKKFRFAIDRGGTFTDIVCQVLTFSENAANPLYSVSKTVIHKLLSANPAYEDAPLEGIRQVISREMGVSPGALIPIPSK